MRISNVRVFSLSAPIPPERRWTSNFGTNTKQDLAIVILETDDGLTGYGEAKGTPVVMKVLVEDVLGPSLVGEDPTRVEFLWEKMCAVHRECDLGIVEQDVTAGRQDRATPEASSGSSSSSSD